MAFKKKKEVITEEPVIEEVEVSKDTSAEYEALKALIESYKEQNPEKYEQKKESLEAQLEALK